MVDVLANTDYIDRVPAASKALHMSPAPHVVVTGNDEPALLFVHGFGCTLDDWRAQLEALSPTFRCIALDLPGHGATATPAEATMGALAAAVNIAKEQSGARQVVLVGHSLGAKVVREAYAQSSRNVIGLVFIEGRFNEGDRNALIESAKRSIDSIGFEAWAQRHFAQMFVGSTDRALQARVLDRVRRLDPTFGRSLFLEAVAWDPDRGQQTLEQIAVPVLLLQSTYVDAHHERQTLLPGMITPFMQLVTNLIPRSEAKIVAGCGHFPMIETADLVNDEVRAFALRVSVAARSA
jgi:pimeloyl-ACP methyl ester carboxylesterase